MGMKTCNLYVSVSRKMEGKVRYSNYCIPLATALIENRYTPDVEIAGGKYNVSIHTIDTLNKTALVNVTPVSTTIKPPIDTIDKRKEVKIYKDPTSSSQFYSAILPSGAQLHIGLAEFDKDSAEEFFKILNDRHAFNFDPKTAKASDSTNHNDDSEPASI